MKRVLVLMLILSVSAAYAQHGDGSGYTVGPGWHFLQDIYSADGSVEIDSNNDGAPDTANNLRVNNSVSRVFSATGGGVMLQLAGAAGSYSSIGLMSGGAGGWEIGRNSANNFYIDRIGSGNALMIEPTNRYIGIGTANPRRSLEINGQMVNTAAVDANANLLSYDVGVGSVGASTVYGYSAICTGNNFGSCAGAGGTVIGLANAASANNIPNAGNVYFNNGGNLGVGSNNPVYRLDVYGPAGNYPARVGSPDGWLVFGPANAGWSHFTTDRARFYFNTGMSVDSGLIGSYDEDLNLQTQGTTRITIRNSNGNVGIGTAAPTQRLDVAGNVHATGDICTDQGGGKCLGSGSGMVDVSAAGTHWTMFVDGNWRAYVPGGWSAGAQAAFLNFDVNCNEFQFEMATPSGTILGRIGGHEADNDFNYGYWSSLIRLDGSGQFMARSTSGACNVGVYTAGFVR